MMSGPSARQRVHQRFECGQQTGLALFEARHPLPRFITRGRRPAHARGEAAPAVPFLHPHGRTRIASEHMGSIDAKPVRELVEEILEGGKESLRAPAPEVRVLRSGVMNLWPRRSS